MSGAGSGRLTGKIALVTGAASGIGLATTRMFISQGAAVVMSDINAEAGEAEAKRLRGSGGLVIFVAHDVTSEPSWVAAIQAVRTAHGRLDILVNNAGVGTGGSIEDATLEEWRQIHAVNADGPFLGCKHGIALMKQSGDGGSIVNISSVAGIIGAPQLAAYCASKGSVRLLTKSVALHCARKGYGIRCNSVHPSYTDTPMVNGMVEQHRAPDRYRAALEGASPMGRLGQADDVAGAILYLASDDAKFTTGAEIVVDGGLTAT
jgi:NAD(P)-dependent dehydrogenase (short-subunit alcohol dehydrogenase family)